MRKNLNMELQLDKILSETETLSKYKFDITTFPQVYVVFAYYVKKLQ